MTQHGNIWVLYARIQDLCQILLHKTVKFRDLEPGEDVRVCDLVHLVNRSYNTLKEVWTESDMNKCHVLSIVKQKMCSDDSLVKWPGAARLKSHFREINEIDDCRNEVTHVRHCPISICPASKIGTSCKGCPTSVTNSLHSALRSV